MAKIKKGLGKGKGAGKIAPETADDASGEIGLRLKLETFCQEYVIDFNGSRAATAAGYAKESAGVEACRLLKSANIKARVAELIAEKAAVREVTDERIEQEMIRLALGDATQVVSIKGKEVTITDTDKLTPAQKAMIAGIVQTKGKNPKIEVKFHDKTKALDLLARRRGMLKDQGEKGAAIIILESGEGKL